MSRIRFARHRGFATATVDVLTRAPPGDSHRREPRPRARRWFARRRSRSRGRKGGAAHAGGARAGSAAEPPDTPGSPREDIARRAAGRETTGSPRAAARHRGFSPPGQQPGRPHGRGGPTTGTSKEPRAAPPNGSAAAGVIMIKRIALSLTVIAAFATTTWAQTSGADHSS